MSHFLRQLGERNPEHGRRNWYYVAYDQLFPMDDLDPAETGIVMLECPAKAGRRPYHKQKLAYVLANGRQYALEQAARGVAVRWAVAQEGYAEGLRRMIPQTGPLRVMEPAERELRKELEPLMAEGLAIPVAHPGWLSTPQDFEKACPKQPYRMDAFYRQIRSRTGVLMRDGAPEGGKWSFDSENRQSWDGTPAAPAPLAFRPDEVTREVGALIERYYADHPGTLDLGTLPATAADTERVWSHAKGECLPQFGPYEDAFSYRSRSLFHTRISPLLNLGRLMPGRVVGEVERMDLPIASKEGFIRQILGWREFVYRVHRATDGFRKGGTPVDGRGQAMPSFLGAHGEVPPPFWTGAATGMACVDDTLEAVWEEGYSHHITRLMVLSNVATLLEVEPRALTDWFWAAYVDAFDWVVEPNVLGMGTFGAGEVMTTKPYVAGTAYLERMGDLCGRCRLEKKCPMTALYWAFLERHAEALRRNPRVAGPVASALRRSEDKREADRATFERVRDTLARGERID